MKFMLRCAAVLAVALSIAAPVHAQQQPSQGAQDTGDYKPPVGAGPKKPTQTGESAAPQKGQKPSPQSAQKTIGLITTIGDTFYVKRVGITVFGNEADNFPVAAWKVNDRVAAKVTSLFKKNFKIKSIAASENAFASLSEPGRLFRNYDDDYDAIVRNLASAQKADYYLVISTGSSRVGDTNQSISGMGVLRLGGLFPGDYVHALTRIRVYDSGFKMLRSEVGSIGQDTFLTAVRGPHLVLDDEAKRFPPEAQAVVNDPRAKELALDLLDKSLAMTLPKLFAQD